MCRDAPLALNGIGFVSRLLAGFAAGENRVTVIEPAAAPGSRDANDVKLEFKYDHLSRRVEKKVTAWDPTLNGGSGNWESTATTHLKYGYDGDELVIEYNGLNSDSVERRYRWALGKLWWMRKLTGARYMMMRDVQDNVTMLVKRTGLAVEGIYEYDALGNVLSVAGFYGEDNPMRWGSGYRDAETGFVANRGGLTDPVTGRTMGIPAISSVQIDGLNREAFGLDPSVVEPVVPVGGATAPIEVARQTEVPVPGSEGGGGCTCTVTLKANGAHLYINFKQAGCGNDFEGNAHWGPCGFIGMCPRGSIGPHDSREPYPKTHGNNWPGNGWGDTGDDIRGPIVFSPDSDDTGGGGDTKCNPCECLLDIMDAKYRDYWVTGPNSNSAAMEAARQCGIDTAGVTGFPGQGLKPVLTDGGLEGDQPNPCELPRKDHGNLFGSSTATTLPTAP